MEVHSKPTLQTIAQFEETGTSALSGTECITWSHGSYTEHRR